MEEGPEYSLPDVGQNKATWCDICEKDLCKSWYKRDHMLRKHGIGGPVTSTPTPGKQGRPKIALDMEVEEVQEERDVFTDLNVESEAADWENDQIEMANDTFEIEADPIELETDPIKMEGNLDYSMGDVNQSKPTWCELCQKDLCNEKYKITHMKKKHGINLSYTIAPTPTKLGKPKKNKLDMDKFDSPKITKVSSLANQVSRQRQGASPYNLWANQHRKLLVQENPGMHNNEISRMLGMRWRGLSKADKAAYVEEAKAPKMADETNKVVEQDYSGASSKVNDLERSNGDLETDQEDTEEKRQTLSQWRDPISLNDFEQETIKRVKVEDKNETASDEGFAKDLQQFDKPAFDLWAEQRREKMKKENQFVTDRAIDWKLGQQWKNLSDSEKKQYVKEAKMHRMAIENIKVDEQDKSDASSKVNGLKRPNGDPETEQEGVEEKKQKLSSFKNTNALRNIRNKRATKA